MIIRRYYLCVVTSKLMTWIADFINMIGIFVPSSGSPW